MVPRRDLHGNKMVKLLTWPYRATKVVDREDLLFHRLIPKEQRLKWANYMKKLLLYMTSTSFNKNKMSSIRQQELSIV